MSRHRCEAPQRIEVDEHESVRMNCWERCTKVFDAHDDWYPKHDYYFFVNGNAELVDNLPRDNWVCFFTLCISLVRILSIGY